MKKLIFLVLFCLFILRSFADLRLPHVLNDHMVLQQQSTVKLWGWANPGSKVYIKTSWNNKLDSTRTSRNADWTINIQTPSAGGPYTISFTSGNTITLNDIMIGEVWVCSGQSNMEMNVQWGQLADVKAELPTCANNNIRFFYIPKATSRYPQDDCIAEWTVCDSNTLKTFSAAGYFFGKKLNKELNVPIGLINSNWGGTPAEVWTPEDEINSDSLLKEAAAKQGSVPGWPRLPGYTFNGMIAPITNFSIAGAIWYQGEANVGTANTYSKLLTTMIGAWRKAWNKDFPFYYVQIAPYKYGNNKNGALLQEAQTQASHYPNVGMVVVTDLVADTNNIHPTDKHDVGLRLANWALAETYHKTGIAYKSPLYNNISIAKGKAVISFDNVLTGLSAKDKNITQLLIAGDDKVFYPAEAKIDKNTLIVWSKQVPKPVAVRYAFGNTAIGNLFSKEGLPVTAFRTDDWDAMASN